MPIKNRINALNTGMILNLIGMFLYAIPIYIGCFLLVVIFAREDAWWVALLALLVLFVIGLITHWRGVHDEWRSYERPFSNQSGGAYAANRLANRVFGPAFLMDELVMGSSGQLLKFLGKRRIVKLLGNLDENRVMALMRQLKQLGTNPRFHPVHSFKDSFDILGVMIVAELIWTKDSAGEVLIGLNREFDDAV